VCQAKPHLPQASGTSPGRYRRGSRACDGPVPAKQETSHANAPRHTSRSERERDEEIINTQTVMIQAGLVKRLGIQRGGNHGHRGRERGVANEKTRESTIKTRARTHLESGMARIPKRNGALSGLCFCCPCVTG